VLPKFASPDGSSIYNKNNALIFLELAYNVRLFLAHERPVSLWQKFNEIYAGPCPMVSITCIGKAARKRLGLLMIILFNPAS
jgi:hypothetical protein